MSFLDRAASQMSGAWAMAFNLDGWRERLDQSADAVFESFKAFVAAAPLVALYTLTMRRASQRLPDFDDALYNAAPLAPLMIGDLALFAIDWAVSLFLLIMLSRSLGAGKDAAGLIVGFNWSQPIITAIQVPPVALAAATASPAAAGLLGFPALALTLAVIWGVVRRGLSVSAVQGAAIIAMLIVAGALVRAFGDAAMRALFVS